MKKHQIAIQVVKGAIPTIIKGDLKLVTGPCLDSDNALFLKYNDDEICVCSDIEQFIKRNPLNEIEQKFKRVKDDLDGINLEFSTSDSRLDSLSFVFINLHRASHPTFIKIYKGNSKSIDFEVEYSMANTASLILNAMKKLYDISDKDEEVIS